MSNVCDHPVKVKLLFCIFSAKENVYEISVYKYCNNCAGKVDFKETLLMAGIPEMKDDNYIVKVIANVKSNNYEYEWFGHQEDRVNYLKNGDKWQ